MRAKQPRNAFPRNLRLNPTTVLAGSVRPARRLRQRRHLLQHGLASSWTDDPATHTILNVTDLKACRLREL